MSDDHFLARWSRRKHAANRGDAPKDPPPSQSAQPAAPAQAPVAAQDAAPVPEPLPPVESITAQTDVSGFLKPGVDPSLKQAALKKFFRDPRFNVMDGLDVYIDDYSKPDPLPEEWLGKLNQLARLGDYPAREAERAKQAEKDAEAARIEEKTEEPQSVEEPKVAASAQPPQEDETPPEVGTA